MTGMQISLIVRGQHPPGDTAAHLRDDLELVKRADQVGFDGIVKGSHYSAHPFQSVQQIPFLAYAAAIAPRLRLILGLVLLPLHKPLDLAEQLATLDILSNGKLVCRCGAKSLSRRPVPRRSAAPSPTSKRNTRPTAPGGRTR